MQENETLLDMHWLVHETCPVVPAIDLWEFSKIIAEKEKDLVATGICPSFVIDRLEACPAISCAAPISIGFGIKLSRITYVGEAQRLDLSLRGVKRRSNPQVRGLLRFARNDRSSITLSC
jgi:hypothetical protein